jgi:hypothetical protein
MSVSPVIEIDAGGPAAAAASGPSVLARGGALRVAQAGEGTANWLSTLASAGAALRAPGPAANPQGLAAAKTNFAALEPAEPESETPPSPLAQASSRPAWSSPARAQSGNPVRSAQQNLAGAATTMATADTTAAQNPSLFPALQIPARAVQLDSTRPFSSFETPVEDAPFAALVENSTTSPSAESSGKAARRPSDSSEKASSSSSPESQMTLSTAAVVLPVLTPDAVLSPLPQPQPQPAPAQSPAPPSLAEPDASPSRDPAPALPLSQLLLVPSANAGRQGAALHAPSASVALPGAAILTHAQPFAASSTNAGANLFADAGAAQAGSAPATAPASAAHAADNHPEVLPQPPLSGAESDAALAQDAAANAAGALSPETLNAPRTGAAPDRNPSSDSAQRPTHASSNAEAVASAAQPVPAHTISTPPVPAPSISAQSVAAQAENSAFAHGGAGAHASQAAALPASASISSAARETFAALDGEIAPGAPTAPTRPAWTSSGAHSVEAGFEDPSLGWVGVRADLGAGGVHAFVVPGSAEAAQALGSQMAGLHAYLTEQRTPVGSLTLESPEGGNAFSGANTGANSGTNSETGGNQQNPQQPSATTVPSLSGGAAHERAASSIPPVASDPSPLLFEHPGAYISVLA